MAKSQVYKRGRASVSFNMTPMIDCTFQLIIFFMLTTQTASADFVRLNVPKPDYSQARKPDESNRAMVNVVPYSPMEIEQNPALLGLAKEYRVGVIVIRKGDTEKLIHVLKAARKRCPDPKKFAVEIRADKQIRYNQIEPILAALEEAKLSKMYITAMLYQPDY